MTPELIEQAELQLAQINGLFSEIKTMEKKHTAFLQLLCEIQKLNHIVTQFD